MAVPILDDKSATVIETEVVGNGEKSTKDSKVGEDGKVKDSDDEGKAGEEGKESEEKEKSESTRVLRYDEVFVHHHLIQDQTIVVKTCD